MGKDQRFPKVLLWAEISGSQVMRSYWVHLWCSPSADWNQSARRLYIIGGLYLPCSVGCLCSGSQHKIWSEWIFHILCFPRALCLPLHLCFLGPVLLSVNHSDRSVGGCAFYSHCHVSDTEGPLFSDPFCDFVQCFVNSQTRDPCPKRNNGL